MTTKNTAKLDRETEELKHDKIPLDLGKLIQQGRQAKGWSQKDLATVCSFDSFTENLYFVWSFFIPQSNITKQGSSAHVLKKIHKNGTVK